MSKLRLFLSVFCAFLSLAAAITATAADELKIVYNVGVAPLKFEDAASRPAGLFPDLWRLWAQKAGCSQARNPQFIALKRSLSLLPSRATDQTRGPFN